jgi:hypothetical protein
LEEKKLPFTFFPFILAAGRTPVGAIYVFDEDRPELVCLRDDPGAAETHALDGGDHCHPVRAAYLQR